MFYLGTALFLLCATAIVKADLILDADDTDLDTFYENGCPKDVRITKLLPHENCGQFYQCFHGALVSRFCPNGLNFNPDLEKCDWHVKCLRKRIEENRTVFEELDTNNPKDAFLICQAPDSNDILVAHENCNEFYKCSHGRPVLLKCAQDLLYNTVTEKCDWAQNVDCGDRNNAESERNFSIISKEVSSSKSIEEIDHNSVSRQANSICLAQHSDGVFIAHEHCNKFYKCSGGSAISVKCPHNLLYDPIKGHCDWPINVRCDGRLIPQEEVGTASEGSKDIDNEDNEIPGDDDEITVTGICAADNSEGVVTPHEMCNYFYKCSKKEPVPFKCQRNLLFNTKNNLCDWPSNVDCGDRIKSDGADSKKEKRSEYSTQAQTVCSTQGSDGVLVPHESCNQFYKCLNGNPIDTKCPSMLLYNPKAEICDWPNHVDCNGRKASDFEDQTHPYFMKEDIDRENVNEDENNANNENEYRHANGNYLYSGHLHIDKNNVNIRPPYKDNALIESVNNKYNYFLRNAAKICADANSDGLLLLHKNCNQYYKCIDRRAVAQSCQVNLFYNHKMEYCDWLQNVDCSNRVVPEFKIINEKNDNDADVCEGYPNGSILPHENCSQFYKCINGRKYAMECLPGLYYDSALKVCDWPMNVDCGDRLTEAQLRNQ